MKIIRGTTVDGPGFRTSIYLAGCIHKCEGCHNPHSWNPSAGTLMSLVDIMKVVEEEDFDVTLTGGDPLFKPIQTKVLIKALKENRRNVWIYTGYTWDEILKDHTLLSAIEEADVIVDGKFILKHRNTDIAFRGSVNQRIINIKESLRMGFIVFYSI